jgi:O-acetyl-ADP-ribose deacetylase
MNVDVVVGDIFDEPADVLVCPANPWLNLSGGLGGAILERGCHSIQVELHAHLAKLGKSALPAGSVVVTNADSLPFKKVIHAVAIDPFYESNVTLVSTTLRSCMELAASLHANSIAIPALGTGYGRLPMEDFANAAAALFDQEWPSIATVKFVVRSEESAEILREFITKTT